MDIAPQQGAPQQRGTPSAGLGEQVPRVSAGLRARVRSSELGLVLLGAVTGAVAGVFVVLLSTASRLAHQWLYGLEHGHRLSEQPWLPTPALLIPAAGGLVLGLLGLLLARFLPRSHPPVDPIEANAMHGGRIPPRDAAEVVTQNLVSNGAGASVGMEAAYTQCGATFASSLGRDFGLRRADQRVLVGCGAAGAIAAAFSAPLTGAFYAFELVIGVYSLGGFLPVISAAVAADFVVRALDGPPDALLAGSAAPPGDAFYAASVLLGIGAGLLAIGVMRGVGLAEAAIRRAGVPEVLRPAFGGVLVGALAWATLPAVLSAGHGALHKVLSLEFGLVGLATLFLAKAAASAISVGSGFRGGLFFASLLLGAMVGRAGALLGSYAGLPADALDEALWALAGMAAFGTAVVGAPLALTFLVIETTGAFAPALAVLPAVAAAALTVRRLFGYSFATWRFHLRGETIRSAHDMTWVEDLKVGTMMRRDVPTVPLDTPLEAFRVVFPLGSQTRVVAVDAAGRYAGLVTVSEAHAAPPEPGATIAPLLRHTDQVLLPGQGAKSAMASFDASEAEALVVLDGAASRRVAGILTEAHLLRRYGEELDKLRRQEAGLPG